MTDQNRTMNIERRFLVSRRRLIEVIETSGVIADTEEQARLNAQARGDWREVERDQLFHCEYLSVVEIKGK